MCVFDKLDGLRRPSFNKLDAAAYVGKDKFAAERVIPFTERRSLSSKSIEFCGQPEMRGVIVETY
jgi:hypothetical protein